MNWIPNVLRRRKLYDDLSEEIRLHLEERAEQLKGEGMSPKEAEQAARRAFGNRTLVEEHTLDKQLNSELGQLHIERQPDLASHRPAGGATSAAEPGLICPKCKKGHLRRPNGKDFFGCDQYRDGCTFSVNVVIAKKKLTDKQIETLVTKGKTGIIKGFTSKQDKPFDAFLVCTEATEWRTKFEFESK
jgi:hypothetical protein